MFLTVLIHIFCVLRQLRQCNCSWTKFLITLKHKKCVTARSGKVFFICSMFLIGLWHNNKLKHGMMTVNIMMIMMRLLSGMMVIKNARLRKQKLRKNFCLCLASITLVGLVCSWGQEKRDRKIVEVVVFWPSDMLRLKMY